MDALEDKTLDSEVVQETLLCTRCGSHCPAAVAHLEGVPRQGSAKARAVQTACRRLRIYIAWRISEISFQILGLGTLGDAGSWIEPWVRIVQKGDGSTAGPCHVQRMGLTLTHGPVQIARQRHIRHRPTMVHEGIVWYRDSFRWLKSWVGSGPRTAEDI